MAVRCRRCDRPSSPDHLVLPTSMLCLDCQAQEQTDADENAARATWERAEAFAAEVRAGVALADARLRLDAALARMVRGW